MPIGFTTYHKTIFVAFPVGRVYTALDERSSSLKGIVRSRDLLMEVEGLS
jgi:hypothetical protein